MSLHEDEHGPCPFTWGDRIDHPKFGFGKVVSEPIECSGPIADPSHPGGFRIGAKGWSMDIEWEDEARGTTSMGSNFLTVVERPDAKGEAYWANEYEKILKKVQLDRSRTAEALARAFRDKRDDRLDASAIRERLLQEKANLEALLNFLDADEAGEHH